MSAEQVKMLLDRQIALANGLSEEEDSFIPRLAELPLEENEVN